MTEPRHRNVRIREVPAVTRAIAILKLLRRRGSPLALIEIARELDVVPSTCLHILRTLAEEGLVIADPVTKRYRLGLGLLAFGASVLRQNAFAEEVQPALDQVAQTYRVTTFAIERANEALLTVVAVCNVSKTFSVRIDVGTTFPAWSSASGRCVAAASGASREELAARFATLRWQDPPSFEDWLAEVEQARGVGYGIDQSHYFRGVTIVSVPIDGDRGAVTRCLAAAGLTDQLDPHRTAALVEMLKREAARWRTSVPDPGV